MDMHKSHLLLLAFVLVALPCFADDTIEASATNNINVEKAPELVMQDETLKISKAKDISLGNTRVNIDVDFHFKNISNHDVTKKIAFVLPPVFCREDKLSSWAGLDANTDNTFPGANALNDFSNIVDGKTQKFTIRRQAVLGQRDITDLLTQLQIPLNPCNIHITSDGDPDPRYAANLKKYQLLTGANEPAWSENVYYEWMQTFPAGKVINIHHNYTTTTGGSVLAARTSKELSEEFTENKPVLTPLWDKPLKSLSASNPALVKTVNNEAHYCVLPIWVEYNLITGANWQGGIKNFQLIISDASGAPFAVNQFYKNEKVETKGTGDTLTFTMTNFIPTQNILVQYLSLPQSQAEVQGCG
jgi:hypothetical protein